MIAYCGLLCDTCPIHLATIEKDKLRQQQMRMAIVKECFKKYGMKLQPEDVNDCDGCCSSTGRIFSGCLTCEVRKCVMGKNLKSCAYCNDYICVKLREHLLVDPEAQERLEELRYAHRLHG